MMRLLGTKKSLPCILGYICLTIYVVTHLSMVSVWIKSRVFYKPCAEKYVQTSGSSLRTPLQRYVQDVTFHRRNIKCQNIISEDSVEIGRARTYLKQHNYVFSSFPERVFSQVPNDCVAFKSSLGYKSTHSSTEASFPLAFSIITHDNIEQVERLLRMVYSPGNIYCIHVDLKSSPEFVSAVKSLSSCFPNVFLTSRRENVIYAHFSRLRAELNCIEDLLEKDNTWKYYLNLASSEIPIKSNLEMVKVLMKLKGANDIEEIFERKRSARFMYRHGVVDDMIHRTRERLPPPPHNLTMTKGVAYGAFSRKFLEFTFTNRIATDFLNWTKDTFSPDEHYWATLNNLYHNPFLRSPGGSKAEPARTSYISRFIVWKGIGHRHKCYGMFRHNICVFGLSDINTLISLKKKLVVNKFDLKYDPVTYSCMEEFLRNKTLFQTE